MQQTHNQDLIDTLSTDAQLVTADGDTPCIDEKTGYIEFVGYNNVYYVPAVTVDPYYLGGCI